MTAGTSCIASKTQMAGIAAHGRAFFSVVCILNAKRDFACTCVLDGAWKLYCERKVLFHGLQLQSARTAVQKATAHIHALARIMAHSRARTNVLCITCLYISKRIELNFIASKNYYLTSGTNYFLVLKGGGGVAPACPKEDPENFS